MDLQNLLRPIRMAFVTVAIVGAMLVPAASQVKDLAGTPNMKLQGLDGRVYDMNDLRGNVVLVSLGATWCSPCSAELKALEELLTEYRNQPVKFYWVSIESPDQISNAVLKR